VVEGNILGRVSASARTDLGGGWSVMTVPTALRGELFPGQPQANPRVFLETTSQTGSSPKRWTKKSTNTRVFAARYRLGSFNEDTIAFMTSISETTPFQMVSRRGASGAALHPSLGQLAKLLLGTRRWFATDARGPAPADKGVLRHVLDELLH
jgi:hypothetical protein